MGGCLGGSSDPVVPQLPPNKPESSLPATKESELEPHHASNSTPAPSALTVSVPVASGSPQIQTHRLCLESKVIQDMGERLSKLVYSDGQL